MTATDDTSGLVSIRLGDATFGVPVLQVQDVVSETPLNLVPLAPPEVAGVMNLRGRIVTAIDMRRRFELPAVEDRHMSVIVEHRGELYALIVDDVGDVLWLPDAEREPAPRGWYAAPVGWFDDSGQGEFAVAIRSGLLCGSQAYLYAGAGIVRGSDPDAEFAETRLKQRAVLDAHEHEPNRRGLRRRQRRAHVRRPVLLRVRQRRDRAQAGRVAEEPARARRLVGRLCSRWTIRSLASTPPRAPSCRTRWRASTAAG